MRIGFDVDGVIYRFTKAYHLWLNANRGMSLDPDVEAQTWDWFKEWESYDEFCMNLHEAVDSGEIYWQGELCEPNIAQNLRDLRAAGHTIHVVSARLFGVSKCAWQATNYFFEQNDLVYDTLHIAADKRLVETDLFLEDNLYNYLQLEAIGTTSYLVDMPYNQSKEPARRVKGVDEFTKLILEDSWQRSDLWPVY